MGWVEYSYEPADIQASVGKNILQLHVKYNSATRIPEMLGRFFFVFFYKIKTKYFQVTWANILFTIEHIEHNTFKQIHFTLLSTKWTNFKFDACYRSQKSWHGGNKRIQLGEHLAPN